jgi:hypothetical protein
VSRSLVESFKTFIMKNLFWAFALAILYCLIPTENPGCVAETCDLEKPLSLKDIGGGGLPGSETRGVWKTEPQRYCACADYESARFGLLTGNRSIVKPPFYNEIGGGTNQPGNETRRIFGNDVQPDPV